MTRLPESVTWLDHRVYRSTSHDAVIAEQLAPLLDDVAGQCALRQIFREWQGGPNIRVSLLVDGSTAADVASALRHRLGAAEPGTPAARPAADLELALREGVDDDLPPQPDNSVLRIAHPDRAPVLGGADAVALFDRFHHLSTGAAIDSLRAAGGERPAARMRLAVALMLLCATRFPGPLRLGGMSFRSHVEGAIMESATPDRLRAELSRLSERWLPRLTPLVELVLRSARTGEPLHLPGLAAFTDGVEGLVPEARRLLALDRLRLPLTGRHGETSWDESVLARSPFHARLQRDPRWLAAAASDPVLRLHRVLVNWTYLHLTRLGVTPGQRLALGQVVADVVDRHADTEIRFTPGARDTAGLPALRYARDNRTGVRIPEGVDWSELPAPRPVGELTALPDGRPTPAGGLDPRSPDDWGTFLRCAAGASRLRPAAGAERFPASVHRVVSSAGQRYPADLHTVFGDTASARYEPVHHALARPAGPEPAGVPRDLVVTVTPWRTEFKYGEFAYRLQCMDAGVLVGQTLAVAEAAGWDLGVCYHFPDAEVDRVIGVDGTTTRSYAVLTAGPAAVPVAARPAPVGHPVEDAARARPGAPRVSAPPLLGRLRAGVVEWVDLPPTDPGDDAWTARRSSLGFFGRGGLTAEELAGLLDRIRAPYRNDLPGGRCFDQTAHVVTIGDVAGVAPGVYLVVDGRRLGLLRRGDVRHELRHAVTRSVIDVGCVPVALTVVTDYEAALPVHGDRWYRIQGMEAGIATQRGYLAAAARSLACQAHCGLDPDVLMTALGLADQHLEPMIQLLVGRPKDVGFAYELGVF
ncbi:lantibiotic dehydratase C-terminal domain-containing protein [Actinosynnema sp. NPDC047251]|uniref:Putative oxidoreductase n=1 Tax=Saccharothrix espanaensis (strain ATCC 51144 / DSM 44229 / JCM 9112 / NBRC 15066 / NRRL 15764) TaxID=1179773 RepID=K0K513_SACES|nr:lantibiotic dehydratase C-terminal domain-containing protein [Saccharothrix espanaensis]CCH32672.1 putative oxidoreductase [Saccharothrix espanaensis DSM 44229]